MPIIFDHWRFTVNVGNSSAQDDDGYPTFVDGEFEVDKRITYMILGKEVGEETGNKHLQCYIQLDKPYQMKTVKKIIEKLSFKNCNMGPCDGDDEQNVNYCKKQGMFVEHGERRAMKGRVKQQGKRSDLEMLSDDLKKGATKRKLAEDHTTAYIKYAKGVEHVYEMINEVKPRDFKSKVIWLSGGTGVGKTMWTKKVLGDEELSVYKKSLQLKALDWWDDYEGQDVLLLEEYRGQFEYSQFLDLLDAGEYKVQRRGKKDTQFISKYIIITSPQGPRGCYINANEDIKQLERRIDKWYELSLNEQGETIATENTTLHRSSNEFNMPNYFNFLAQ